MLRFATWFTVCSVLAGIGLLATQTRDWQGVFFFVPFSLGPLLLNLVPAIVLSSRRSQAILAFAAVAYFAWFSWVYYQAFFANPDPQSAIALVFVGIYALPVMIVLWIVAAVVNWTSSRADNRNEFKAVGEATGDAENPYLPPHAS